MPILLASAVIVSTAAGAFAQRVSGLGFSLIAAPSLALAVGPRDGIALTNLLAIVVAMAVFALSARHVDAGKAAVLIPSGLIGVVPGTIVFHLLPASWLQVAVGAVTGLGLAAISATRRLRAAAGMPVTGRRRAAAGMPATAAAGLASGFTTAVGGAGGPALTIYASATQWPQPQFAATGQISYAVQAAAALALKGGPRLPFPWLGGMIAAALAGLACAHLLAHRVSPARARRAAIVIAALASAATVIHGVVSLA
jgi:uncharacterized membrane protein YfcA